MSSSSPRPGQHALDHTGSAGQDYAVNGHQDITTAKDGHNMPTSNDYSWGPYGGNPLARNQTNESARYPAFAGELQPGLYRPDTQRKFANPVPLGLMGFAGTTFVLSAINFSTDGVTQPNMVVGISFAWGGLAQLLAGMWDMALGNTFGATVLSSYGAFWISLGIILTPSFGIQAAYPDVATFNHAFGLYIWCWFITTVLFTSLTLKSTVVFFLLFFWVDISFLCLGISHTYTNAADGGANVAWTKAGGMFGLLAAFFAWYIAIAGIAERTNSFYVVPVWHFPWSEQGKEMKKIKSQESDANNKGEHQA